MSSYPPTTSDTALLIADTENPAEEDVVCTGQAKFHPGPGGYDRAKSPVSKTLGGIHVPGSTSPPPQYAYTQMDVDPQLRREILSPQQQVVVVAADGGRWTNVTTHLEQPTTVSFTHAYVFSCVVYWCFCLILGVIAYAVAAAGESYQHERKFYLARKYRNASLGISVAGVFIGIAVITTAFVLLTHPTTYTYHSP